MINKILLSIKAIKNIHIFILEFLGLNNNPKLTYILRNNTKIIARSKTTDSAEVIIINSDLEYPIRHFSRVNNQIILDIGANIGAFSIYAGKYLENYAPIIYAIEPSKENYSSLLQNIELNKMNFIMPRECAIYDTTGVAQLDTSTSYDSFRLLTEVENTHQYEKVRTYTLEDFCKTEDISLIDILKIDIEGGEYRLFDKSHNYISNHVKKILVELHPNKNQNIDTFINHKIMSNFNIVDRIMNRTLVLVNKIL